MGRSRRPTPRRLAFKLYAIRKHLGLSLKEMMERLEYDQSPLKPGHIWEYEQGKREPPLVVLLRYAHVIGVCVDVLIDDGLDLPSKLHRYTQEAEAKADLKQAEELLEFIKSSLI